jgi:hypothetical protein
LLFRYSALLAAALAAFANSPATAQTIGQPVRLHDADQRANTVTASVQGGGRIAALTPSGALPQGGHVAAWSSGDFMVRRFGADGAPVDSVEVVANARTTGSQAVSAIAGRPDGGFVVAWTGPDGDSYGPFFRRFGSDGMPLDTDDVRASASITGYQYSPALSVRSDGSFVIVWKAVVAGGYGTFARRFSADGTALDQADIQVHVKSLGDRIAAVVARPDGSFVVAWDGRDSGMFARRFSSDGTALDPGEIAVTTSRFAWTSAIALGPDGSFVVAWATDTGWNNDIFRRRFAADGTPLDATPQITNATTAGHQWYPDVASGPSGSLVATWTSTRQDKSGHGVYARRFNPDGTSPDAKDVLVNHTTSGEQQYSSVAWLPDGETIAFVWEGNGPGDVDGIFFNRFRIAGAPVARSDTATAAQPGAPVRIAVLANDADPDAGDTLTVTAATATHGTVVINADNTLSYTAPAGCGATSDTIAYTITDSTSKTASATVAVTILQAPLMSVTPSTGARLYGNVGGPFPPPYASYTIANVGCAPLDFLVNRDNSWLGRAPATGTIAPGASETISAKTTFDARSLSAGTYTTRLRFLNLLNQAGNTNRIVALNVLPAFGFDAFAAATTLPGASGSSWGSNVGAKGQTGEPDHAGVSLPLASVWWNWTAPTTGLATFMTKGSSFDTTLAVYTGSAVDALTLVAANDDFPSIAPQSRVTFNAVAGTTYRIAVDGKGSEEGLVRLIWLMQ